MVKKTSISKKKIDSCYFPILSITASSEKVKEDLLLELKSAINHLFNQYICPWKFSFFGHHHNERAIEVLKSINQCKDIEEIDSILANQLDIFIEYNQSTTLEDKLATRWRLAEQVINLPGNNAPSGYLRIISEARCIVKHHQKWLRSTRLDSPLEEAWSEDEFFFRPTPQ